MDTILTLAATGSRCDYRTVTTERLDHYLNTGELGVAEPCHALGGEISDNQFTGVNFDTFVIQYMAGGLCDTNSRGLAPIALVLVVLRPEQGALNTGAIGFALDCLF